MRQASTDAIVYRDVDIAIKVQKTGNGVFGHADLVRRNEFKGRISLGSVRSRSREVRDRLRMLAKAKVDVWTTVESATVH
jgi:BMFP domain-containing protein YqiC